MESQGLHIVSGDARNYAETTHPAITCSKITTETLEKRCEICSKLTIKTPK